MIISVIFCSCEATKGVYDSTLKSTEPYKFTFTGSQTEFEIFMKRALVSNAFTIADFDKDAGIIATDYKELIDTEKFNMNAAVLAGVSVQSQKGKLVFMYEPKPDNTINFSMAGYLAVDATMSQNLYTKTQVGNGGTLLAQGHPLCMKYKNLLIADPRIKLL